MVSEYVALEDYTRTIENPAKMSFTTKEILIGSSKLPMVTALTAKRDYGSK